MHVAMRDAMPCQNCGLAAAENFVRSVHLRSLIQRDQFDMRSWLLNLLGRAADIDTRSTTRCRLVSILETPSWLYSWLAMGPTLLKVNVY